MRVFVGWSGSTSKQAAEELREWLPMVLHAVRPFISSDMGAGTMWSPELATQLEKSHFAIFCLTAENLGSAWVHFEAGAISKVVRSGTVVPLLLGGLRPADVRGPLAQFTAMTTKKEDFHDLIRNLNRQLGENSLAAEALTRIFERWWPDLEEKLAEIDREIEESTSTRRAFEPKRLLDDLFAEIVDLTRDNSRKLAVLQEQVSKLGSQEQPPTPPLLFDEIVRAVRDKSLLDPLERLGIKGLYSVRIEALIAFAPIIRTEIDRARSGKEAKLWFVATSMKGLFYLSGPAFRARELLRDAAEQSTLDLRIAMLHPAAAALRGNQEEENDPVAIADEILRQVKVLRQIGLLERIRWYSGSPTMFGVATSTHMLLNPYPYGEEAHKSFSLIAVNTPADDDIYTQFKRAHFEQAWNHGEEVPHDFEDRWRELAGNVYQNQTR